MKSYPFVDRELCGYCGACVSVCPSKAIELVDLYVRRNKSLCTGCLACVKVCPLGAMKLDTGISVQDDAVSEHRVSELKHRECDVLVIGGGPAGSLAARAAADKNVEVLMVEKRQEIGSPVRCAEGISRSVLAEFIEPDPRWICAEIHGGRIHAPNGSFVTIDSPDAGLVLERKVFDRELANQAAASGSEVWAKARAVDLIRKNGDIAGAIIHRPDGNYAVRAKVIIAADGVESQVGKWAGINTTCNAHEVDTCAQYFMTGLPDSDSTYCDFYIGSQTAPRGYAWIFPKGNGSANVGLGIGGNLDTETAINHLNKFVEQEVPGGSILGMVVGCVPVTGTLPDLVADGFMIIGDAAHQNDPVSGGGIINAMIAGQIAGDVAGDAVRKGDVSKAVLAQYEERWHHRVGRTFPHLRKIREGILRFSDRALNDIADILLKSNSGKHTLVEIFWTALKNNPRLLLELRHLIAIGWAQKISSG